jgi:CRISPR/Cas system-associated protein Csm6
MAMSRLQCIVSSVGTSVLTNGAPRELQQLLRDTANLRTDELTREQREAIDARVAAVRADLTGAEVARRQFLSAELNGLYGIGEGRLPGGSGCLHFLIATDTYQGESTAKLIAEVLRNENIPGVEIETPAGLSTRSQLHFSRGIRELIRWCEETLPGFEKAGYRVVFNLVGGFKILLGYLNIIGMFYADEIVYRFEGPDSPLLRIPRLPIEFDHSLFERHANLCAQLEAGLTVPPEDLADWPEVLWEEVGPGQARLSTWGFLVWERCRDRLLGQSLLPFPCLEYDASFERDFDGHGNTRERVQLQETLALVSVLLQESKGDMGVLRRHGGLQYENYANTKPPLGHFRVNLALRVNCVAEAGGLRLRQFGGHEIERNPG